MATSFSSSEDICEGEDCGAITDVTYYVKEKKKLCDDCASKEGCIRKARKGGSYLYCEKHDEEIKLYCKTHRISVCYSCILIDHLNQSCVQQDIEGAIMESKERLMTLKEMAKDKLKLCRVYGDQIHQCRKETDIHLQALKDEVDLVINEAIQTETDKEEKDAAKINQETDDMNHKLQEEIQKINEKIRKNDEEREKQLKLNRTNTEKRREPIENKRHGLQTDIKNIAEKKERKIGQLEIFWQENTKNTETTIQVLETVLENDTNIIKDGHHVKKSVSEELNKPLNEGEVKQITVTISGVRFVKGTGREKYDGSIDGYDGEWNIIDTINVKIPRNTTRGDALMDVAVDQDGKIIAAEGRQSKIYVINPADDDEGQMIKSVHHIPQPGASHDETQVHNLESRENSSDGTVIIRLEKHGIEVRIPPNEAYRTNDVTVEPIHDIPPELVLKETEAIITFGLRMSPSTYANFDNPVIVTMPHCGIFTKPEAAEVVTYYRKSASESFRAIPSTNGSPRCVVRHRDLDVYMDHFSEIWIVALFTRVFIGKRVICTSYIPVSTPRNAKHVLFVHVRNENIAEKVYRGYIAPLEGEQFLVKWRSGGLRITCKESIPIKDEVTTLQESEIRHLTEHKVMFTVDTRTTDMNKMILNFILQQSTTKQIMVNMHLEEISETSQGKTNSASQINSASTRVDIPPQGASAAPFEVNTSKAKPTVESMEQNFDEILKTVAEQIHKDSDIDNLGVKLGFNHPDITRYIQKNKQDNTYMGTLDMLRDWTHKTKRSEEHEQLEKALIAINHHRLAEDLLKDDMAS